MKKIVLIILILISSNNYAQEVSITKSDVFKDSRKNSQLEYSLEDGNGGIVTIRVFINLLTGKKKGYYIQYFDSDLQLLAETDYKVKHNTLQSAFIKDNQLYLIESELDKDKDKIAYNAVSADLKNLQFNKTEFFSIYKKDQNEFFDVGLSSSISNRFFSKDSQGSEVLMSDNKNFFVVKLKSKNKKKETHKIFVFNTKFEKIYEHLIQLNIKDKFFEYNSLDIDDDGTVYFLGKAFENNSKKSKKKGLANYHFKLIKIDAKGEVKASFKKSTKIISSLIVVKTKEDLLCLGFYGDKNRAGTNGVCVFNLDQETLDKNSEKFNPFSEEFFNNKFGDKKRKKKKVDKNGVENIDFKTVFVMDNGDLIINAEETFITSHTMQNGMTRFVPNYLDIISIRMNKEGDLISASNINKEEQGVVNTSFTSIVVDENSYFLINCSNKIKKNKDGTIIFKQVSPRRSNLYMLKINKDGVLDYTKLIDAKDTEVYYKVNDGAVNLTNRTIILTGKSEHKTSIVKLQF